MFIKMKKIEIKKINSGKKMDGRNKKISSLYKVLSKSF